jgi:hypothetical protein
MMLINPIFFIDLASSLFTPSRAEIPQRLVKHEAGRVDSMAPSASAMSLSMQAGLYFRHVSAREETS